MRIEKNWRKSSKKNVKVRFVDSCEDSNSQTTTPNDSSSDDSVQFVDSSEDIESQSITQTESSSDEYKVITSGDTETSPDSSDNESNTQEDVVKEESGNKMPTQIEKQNNRKISLREI
jgi:hypothetical protein